MSRRACAASTGRCPRRSTASSPTSSRTCCSPTPTRRREPAREGVADERMHLVGNTMIDTLRSLEDRFARGRGAAAARPRARRYLLVRCTGPRTSTARCSPRRCGAWPRSRESCRSSSRSIRGRARLARTRARAEYRRRPLIDPVGYLDFLSLEAGAARVLTDSGGIQEETTVLGVPCFTLRANTERPITITHGTNRVLGSDPARIGDSGAAGRRARRPRPPLWDGPPGAPGVSARCRSPPVSRIPPVPAPLRARPRGGPARSGFRDSPMCLSRVGFVVLVINF